MASARIVSPAWQTDITTGNNEYNNNEHNNASPHRKNARSAIKSNPSPVFQSMRTLKTVTTHNVNTAYNNSARKTQPSGHDNEKRNNNHKQNSAQTATAHSPSQALAKTGNEKTDTTPSAKTVRKNDKKSLSTDGKNNENTTNSPLPSPHLLKKHAIPADKPFLSTHFVKNHQTKTATVTTAKTAKQKKHNNETNKKKNVAFPKKKYPLKNNVANANVSSHNTVFLGMSSAQTALIFTVKHAENTTTNNTPNDLTYKNIKKNTINKNTSKKENENKHAPTHNNHMSKNADGHLKKNTANNPTSKNNDDNTTKNTNNDLRSVHDGKNKNTSNT